LALTGCTRRNLNEAKADEAPKQTQFTTGQPGIAGQVKATQPPAQNAPQGTVQDQSIVYRNAQYGFDFALPKSWEGYAIVTDQWQGLSLGDVQGERVVELGPQLSIRHPAWTQENPRQDIPILVFTLAQWESLQKDEFHIGAAPIPPTELGRNSRYVFALPARYNFAFPTGYEEVEDILTQNPLHPTENFSGK
jgi:hypothetical protein